MMTDARRLDLNMSMSNIDPVHTVTVSSGTTELRVPLSTRVIIADVTVGATLDLVLATGNLPIPIYIRLPGEVGCPTGKITLNGLTVSGGARMLGFVVQGSDIAELISSNAVLTGDGSLITARPTGGAATYNLDGPATVFIAFGLEDIWTEGDVLTVNPSDSLSMIGKSLYVANADGYNKLSVQVNAYILGSSGDTVITVGPEEDLLLTAVGYDSFTGTDRMFYARQTNQMDYAALAARVTALEEA